MSVVGKVLLLARSFKDRLAIKGKVKQQWLKLLVSIPCLLASLVYVQEHTSGNGSKTRVNIGVAFPQLKMLLVSEGSEVCLLDW